MKLTRLGVDVAKQVFQVHGVDRHDKAVWRRRLQRELCKGVESIYGYSLLSALSARTGKWPQRLSPLLVKLPSANRHSRLYSNFAQLKLPAKRSA